LPVARVAKVERRADSGFAQITCVPQALVEGARHVMVLAGAGQQLPQRPPAHDTPGLAPKKEKGPPGLRKEAGKDKGPAP
jgi:rod shape-determining protein MreC